jgi:hypothetical protein
MLEAILAQGAITGITGGYAPPWCRPNGGVPPSRCVALLLLRGSGDWRAGRADDLAGRRDWG